MRKKILHWLDSPLPPQYSEGLDADILRSHYWPTMLAALVVMLLEMGMLFLQQLFPSPTETAEQRQFYFYMYILLLAVTLVMAGCSLLLRKSMQKKPVLFQWLALGYGALICVWASFLSAYAPSGRPSVTVFLYVVLACSILIVARPWQALLLYGGNQALFCFLLMRFSGPDATTYGAMVNSLIATLLVILISSILFRNRATNYYNTVTIVQQNEKIRIINDQLRSLVLTDELTGANNRRYMDEVVPEMVEDALRAEDPMTVMMLDIDRFKQYNDLYGHQAGDLCLAKVADIIRTTMLAENCTFIRYGGEEFVLFLTGQSGKRSIELADTLRRNVARSRIDHTASPWGFLTVSIGVCAVPGGVPTNIYDMVRKADESLYIAKNSGRNRVHLYAESQVVHEEWENPL